MGSASCVSIENISKHFAATVALSGVNLVVEAGEVHGLLGENGAGKSTLMKVLSGVVAPDAGRVLINGAELPLGQPKAARLAGLAMAYQELSSPPNLTVAAKLCLPNLPRSRSGLVSRRKMHQIAYAMLCEWEVADIDPESRIAELSLAHRQHVEIVGALARKPRLLILDEPTAALPDPEWVFCQIKRLASEGTGVIYISHKLTEVGRICDRGSVLRNGHVVGSFSRGEMEEDRLFQLMSGRPVGQTYPVRADVTEVREPLLAIRSMSAGPRLRNVDLDVRRSEIVGVSGLEGQGQRELFYALAGFLRMSSGKVQLSRGEGPSSGAKAVLDRHERRPDLVLVPEERKTEGLFTQMSSQFNLTISHLQALRRAKLIKRRAERAFAKQAANSINLSPLLLSKPVSALSGGNQQKIVLGRAILSRPRCLLLFDPTRGVDASTKTEIYTMIRKYAEGGGAVLMYSTEIPELVGLCDRTYTMYNGGIWVEHKGEKVTNESVLAATLGHSTAQGSA